MKLIFINTGLTKAYYLFERSLSHRALQDLSDMCADKWRYLYEHINIK